MKVPYNSLTTVGQFWSCQLPEAQTRSVLSARLPLFCFFLPLLKEAANGMRTVLVGALKRQALC